MEIQILGGIAVLVSIHFAYSVVAHHRRVADHKAAAQIVRHPGLTSVACGIKKGRV